MNNNLKNFQIFLIGTKWDLRADSVAIELVRRYEGHDWKPVTFSEGKSFAKEIGAQRYFETSASSGKGVHEAMNAILSNLTKEQSCFVKLCCLSDST